MARPLPSVSPEKVVERIAEAAGGHWREGSGPDQGLEARWPQYRPRLGRVPVDLVPVRKGVPKALAHDP